ncbi:MAG: VOC family protein [Candidatus Bathyarchaeia archaeon]|jgi:catechol 2,3-dioxygenase-like lactoylglutathione lyase family enzyme
MRMDHVCVTVPDVDKSIKFYSQGLGLAVLRVSVLNPTAGTEYKNAYMYSGTFLLELITADRDATRGQNPNSWQKAMRGSIGITHLGMRVRNLEAAIQKLKGAGGKMLSEPFNVSQENTNIVYAAERVDSEIRYARRPGKKPWRIAVFSDPDGIIIELVER